MFHDPLLLNLQGTTFAVEFLKLKSVSITERLTKRRVVELKKAKEMYGFKNVRSQDDKILFSDVNDRNKVKVFYD